MSFYTDDELVEIEYDDCLQDTGEGGASLFDIDGDEVWIPNSLIKGNDGSVVEVPRWWAEREGMI